MKYKVFELGEHVTITEKNKQMVWFHRNSMEIVGFSKSNEGYDVYVEPVFYVNVKCKFMFNYYGIKTGTVIESDLPETKLRIKCGDKTYDVSKQRLIGQCIRSSYVELDKAYIRDKKIEKILNKG